MTAGMKSPYVTLALVLLLVSATINVLQGQRIRSLVEAGRTPASTVGHTVSSIQGDRPGGGSQTVSLLNSVPTLVYYFSPTCLWCERNWDNVRALQESAQGRFRLILVSEASRVQIQSKVDLNSVDLIEKISDNSRRDLGLVATPQTVVVAADGLVTHDWRGAYTPRMERQIEELFGIALPGLSPNRQVQASQPSNVR